MYKILNQVRNHMRASFYNKKFLKICLFYTNCRFIFLYISINITKGNNNTLNHKNKSVFYTQYTIYYLITQIMIYHVSKIKINHNEINVCVICNCKSNN